MVPRQTSFWSTTSGVVTGIAGTLTGVVGIATMATQHGWIGGDDDHTASDSTSMTAPPAAADGSATTADGRTATTGRGSRGGTAPADDGPEYTVDPSEVSFSAIGSRTAAVSVHNTGTVEVEVADVAVEGDAPVAFGVGEDTCTGTTIDPGRTCSIELRFTPQAAGAAEAMLVIEVDGAAAREVPLSGVALL